MITFGNSIVPVVSEGAVNSSPVKKELDFVPEMEEGPPRVEFLEEESFGFTDSARFPSIVVQ